MSYSSAESRYQDYLDAHSAAASRAMSWWNWMKPWKWEKRETRAEKKARERYAAEQTVLWHQFFRSIGR